LTFRGRLPITVLALAASLTLGACGSGGGSGNPDSKLTEDEATAALPDGSPPQLAAIREQANELLDGGLDAYEQRLEELRGTPVVVNKWASWCFPCRGEFPFFQELASKHGGEIAFLGIDGNDSTDQAAQFLSELPLPYPSYLDPSLDIADTLDGPPKAFPSTSFYDRSGKLVHTKFGDYKSADELAADIAAYTGARVGG
jgi:thiol-disulfide isomerase/thioredoxin